MTEDLTEEQLAAFERRANRGKRKDRRLLALVAEVRRLRTFCAEQKLSDGASQLAEKGPPVNWGDWEAPPSPIEVTQERLDRLAHQALRRVDNGQIDYVIFGSRMIVASKARNSDDVRRFLCRIEKWNYAFAPRVDAPPTEEL